MLKIAVQKSGRLYEDSVKLLKELRTITGFKTYLFCSNQTSSPKPISEACARNLLHKLGYKNRHCLHGFRTVASTVLHSESI